MTRNVFPNSHVQLDLLSKCNQLQPKRANKTLGLRLRRERYAGAASVKLYVANLGPDRVRLTKRSGPWEKRKESKNKGGCADKKSQPTSLYLYSELN